MNNLLINRSCGTSLFMSGNGRVSVDGGVFDGDTIWAVVDCYCFLNVGDKIISMRLGASRSYIPTLRLITNIGRSFSGGFLELYTVPISANNCNSSPPTFSMVEPL